MNLNIKHLLLGLILLSSPTIAQNNPAATDSITYHKTVSFSMGLIQPIAMGDNFMTNGASTNLGGRFDVRAHFLKKASLGLRFEGFGYDITNPQITGLYERGTVLSVSIAGGYELLKTDAFSVSASAGIGTGNYGNRQENERFSESANILWLGGEVDYAINRYFHFFGGLEFRSDKLDINAPPQIQSQFNNVQYLVIQGGFRVMLWNKEGDE